MFTRNDLVAIFLLGIFSSCSSLDVRPSPVPDGSKGKLVTCTDVEDCYIAASKSCGGKFKIINTSNSKNKYDDKVLDTNILVECAPKP